MKIREILDMMVKRQASDLYLRTKAHIRMRIDGKVEIISQELISRDEMQAATNFLLANEHRWRIFNEKLDIDFVHDEPQLGRFRVNIFMQRGTPSAVIRHVHSHVRSFQDLGLPTDLLKTFCEESKGLFLVCGPAGNGKSTAIASMIDFINHNSAKHIITIEDPIEYLFTDNKSIINQRELGLDVHSYPLALKHITQQSPDILYIGNIRDEETMRAGIMATELGMFVMTTFHTINAVQTIIRIVNFFPPHLHDEVRMQLSMILKGTISLRLIPKKDGSGRIPAFETMVVTPTISRLIREGRIQEIQNFIDQGELFGMQSFRQSLIRLVKAGVIDRVDARVAADSKDEFDLAMKGIKSNFD